MAIIYLHKTHTHTHKHNIALALAKMDKYLNVINKKIFITF